MKKLWIFVALAILAGLGISAAIVRPFHQQVSASTRDVASTDGSDPGLTPATSCAEPRRSGVSQEFLSDETLAARTLLSERRFTDALPQLREVAVADPGYPGINLDIANALLQTNQPTAAREAANRQIAATPRDGKVVLDFNRATNLPCAFTDFATCPLPPAGNHLAFAVEAGEKTPHERG